MSTTPSPYMNLPVPSVGTEPGPNYALDINSALGIIDAHNHTPGQGQAIPPGGLNINTDLPFLGNNATQLRSVNFNVQGAPLSGGSDIGCLYVSGVDLYYNDENGNRIQITASGGVAGTPGSIGGLVSPASVTYAAGVFTFQQAASTSGDLDIGSLTLRNDTASSFGLTLSPPTLSSNYSITLPTLPTAQSALTLDQSGNFATPRPYIPNVGATVGVGGVAVSVGTGTFSTTSTSPVAVSGTSITITTTGRPVRVELQPDPNASGGGFQSQCSGSNLGFIQLKRDGNIVNQYVLDIRGFTSIIKLDVVPAGTYNYALAAYLDSGSGVVNLNISYCALFAYEI